ncbi:glycosyltransferase [Superficieibacter sp.]|uniref:glycosyltransferase n=1 Tax=Superficieibacter sp. TaxID=2303322 RepID=UPI0028A69493|nr:glycosyltransferase [Superficieibacter sp.]
MNDSIIQHLTALHDGPEFRNQLDIGFMNVQSAIVPGHKLAAAKHLVIAATDEKGESHPGITLLTRKQLTANDPQLRTCDLVRIHVNAENWPELPSFISQSDACTLILCDADEDQFSRFNYLLTKNGYRCLAQLSHSNNYYFKKADIQAQHILYTATAENFHFLEPVINIAANQGHIITRLAHEGMTRANLLGTLKHCDTAWFEWGDSAIIAASNMPKYCHIICRIHRYELYRQEFLQVNWSNVDEVIFVSQAMKQRFIKLLADKLPATLTLTVISNLTHFTSITPGKKIKRNPFHIACVARFVAAKNLPLLLLIMQELVKHNSDYQLHIAGRVEDVCLYESFNELVDEFKLSANIVIHGSIPADKMQAWYASKSYLLSASYHESQGMGIFEAMLAGLKPVVFPAAGGLKEYVPEHYYFHSINDAVQHILTPASTAESYRNEALRILDPQNTAERYQQRWQPQNTSPCFFSILIPTYNRGDYVISAICSALNQRYEPFEVIVVDDGSDDDTLSEISQRFDDPRLRVIAKPHSGAPDTRNTAIACAQGEYLVWLDSDDILHSNTLRGYQLHILRHPNIAVVSCALETLGQDKKYFSQRHTVPEKMIHTLAHQNIVSNPGCCVKRDLYQQVGGYDTYFLRAHDYEFWSRAMAVADIMFTPQCNIIYRIHENNLTGIGKAVDQHYEYQIFNNILARYSVQQLLPGKSRKEAEQCLQHKKNALLNACKLDNLVVVIDAIKRSNPEIISQISFLSKQTDRKFQVLIVADKKQDFLHFPLLVCDHFDTSTIRQYITQKYPLDYYRLVKINYPVAGMKNAVELLKNVFIDSSNHTPDCFQILPH